MSLSFLFYEEYFLYVFTFNIMVFHKQSYLLYDKLNWQLNELVN